MKDVRGGGKFNSSRMLHQQQDTRENAKRYFEMGMLFKARPPKERFHIKIMQRKIGKTASFLKGFKLQ